jgi:magnesium-transporting ATPase (P-type)
MPFQLVRLPQPSSLSAIHLLIPFLGIAIIPESLIAVLTITFVTGMTQMRRRRVLTRKLSALEALGGITNICSDKTGTLTQGLMTVRKAWVPGVGIYTVSNSEDPSNPKQGQITVGPAKSKAEMDSEKQAREDHYDTLRSGAALKFDLPAKPTRSDHDLKPKIDAGEEKLPEGTEEYSDMVPELEGLLHSAALCNLATVRLNEQEGKWQTTGDPTEVALQVFAYRFDKGKKILEKNDGWNQIAEYPFDSTVKRMSVVYEAPNTKTPTIFTKGAVERILDLCDNVGVGSDRKQMTEAVKESIYEQMTLLADQGLRVLALATKTWDGEFSENNVPRDKVESGLTLLGLTGLYDPPRLETKDAVRGMYYSSPYSDTTC